MNHAYADGSHQEDLGGWGVVLLVPGQPDAYHHGQVRVSDNGACELHAVLAAVRLAPEGEPLTVHTDATAVVQAVKRGTLHPDQDELGARVRSLALERGVRLRVQLQPRDARRMREAHELAASARLGVPLALPEKPQVRVRVRNVGWGAVASIALRRGGETVREELPLPTVEGVPPSLLALAGVVGMARPGEHLSVRLDSALAAVLWRDPAQLPDSAVRGVVESARAEAEAQGVTLEFV